MAGCPGGDSRATPCDWRRHPVRRRRMPAAAHPPATESAAPAADPRTPHPGAGADAAAAPPAGDTAGGDAAATSPDTRGLDQEVQGLKKDVVDLNRELFVLEEELLFPANTQVAVFISMDVGDFFALDSVTLKIDQKEVINYLYTPREVEALLKGGVHRLYLGNLKVGKHELVAFFSGKGPNDRDYKRGATLKFREGHRREIPGAQDQRPAAQAAAGIRDQGLGIGSAMRPAVAAHCSLRSPSRWRRVGLPLPARHDPEKLPDHAHPRPALRRRAVLTCSRTTISRRSPASTPTSTGI